MEEFEIFKDLISKSVRKNGRDKELTLGHLENLLKMASRLAEERQEERRERMEEALRDVLAEDNYGGT